jgi:hypothetical protein
MVDFTEIKVHGNKVKKIAKKNKDLADRPLNPQHPNLIGLSWKGIK